MHESEANELYLLVDTMEQRQMQKTQ